MTKKQAYSYTVLRYVHDVVSGESLNVGVVMHAPAAGFLNYRTRKTARRLKHVFPDLDREAFISTMKAVDRGLRAIAGQVQTGALFDGDVNAGSYARRAVPNDDSALQWSPPGAGLAADLDVAFEDLYKRYVARYDVKSPKRRLGRRRSNADVWKPVQTKLAQRGIDIPFESKTVRGVEDEIEFKKAWKNGSWHAYESISLDLPGEDDIKDEARKWRGHLDAVHDGATENIDVHLLLGRPDESLMDAYHSATAILKKASFATEVVDEIELDALVESIEKEYRNSMGIVGLSFQVRPRE